MKKIIIHLYALFSFNQIAISAETGGMPQLNPEFWFSQIFWLTISFGILFIVLSKFILPKIRNNLESRKSQIMDNIEIADDQKIKGEKNLKEYDKIIFDAKDSAKKTFNIAKEKIQLELSKEREKIENELNSKIKDAENEIDDLIKLISPGAVNKPTAQVNITNDITLGFISLSNSKKMDASNSEILFALEL